MRTSNAVSGQNDISSLYFQKPDLQSRIKPILALIENITHFSADKLLQQSAWWNSRSVGAMHFSGAYQGKPAVLKVQGVRPKISEADNIAAFARQNRSRIIQPPEVFFSLPWNEKLGFEALILEEISGTQLIIPPVRQTQLSEFFQVYQEYRAHCLMQPWLRKPEKSLGDGIQHSFAQWRKIRQELFPAHPLAKKGDEKLIGQAVEILAQEYQQTDWQFQHGHFSARDIFVKNGQYKVLSNLYWSWRLPYYDAIFGFHWYQFDLAAQENTTVEMLSKHRTWWKEAIYAAIQPETAQGKRLLELAFLERAAAGLNLDGLITPSPAAEWLMDTLRIETQALLRYQG